jgi:hypothetical protein
MAACSDRPPVTALSQQTSPAQAAAPAPASPHRHRVAGADRAVAISPRVSREWLIKMYLL